MIDWAGAGIGLQHDTVALVEVPEAWVSIGQALASQVLEVLADAVADVQHVGSTAVPGLLAKPIIDLALGLRPHTSLDVVSGRMQNLCWEYRGDAGEHGGWVFVLEDAPWHRVAHAHGVPVNGDQWQNYLRLRELLRIDQAARTAYAATKTALMAKHPYNREAYTEGKTSTVQGLLKAEGLYLD